MFVQPFPAPRFRSKVFPHCLANSPDCFVGFQNGSFLLRAKPQAVCKPFHSRGVMKREARRIGYARVSTEDQNLALQLDALKAAGCDRIFCDEGVSGASTSRPALNEALQSLRPGDTLVTWRLDRLGRSLSYLIHIIEALDSDRIEFCSLLEAMDTRTASGEFAFHILGAMAHFERRIISDRTKAGMASARARGVTLGRPLKLTAHQIESARHELTGHAGNVVQIACRLNVAPITLARALKRMKASAENPVWAATR